MINFFRQMSLVPKGLKYKTMIAFSLMSLIPLLICFWLAINFIFPNINAFLGVSISNISLILFISLFISILGLCITRQMIDPIVRMAGEAKIMANGDVSKVIEVKGEDEIGDLGLSLNAMTQKIKENIEELKVYGEQTKMINIEINKKVLALSGLLQIGNLISASTELSKVLNFIAQKVADLEDDTFSLVMLLDEKKKEYRIFSSYNVKGDIVREASISESETIAHVAIVDKNNPLDKANSAVSRLVEFLGVKNFIALPVIVTKKQRGILAVGNNKEDYEFKEDEKELLKVFSKQTSIAIENDLLILKARELAVKDELTGLYNQSYIHTRLDEEIRRAITYQRPCGYLLIDVDDFKNYHDQLGEANTEKLLKALGEMLRVSVTEIDKVGRITSDKFAIVLPEKNKKQSAAIAEDIRKNIEDGLNKVIKTPGKLTVSIGVSENPIDGSSADELIGKAEKLVKQAKSLGKNRVAV
ncbi:MAG: diguanylate cyclase [Candidatus Omnitrophica bacterium]|nr:diguanylate cyclase [Candidatus Omnitrophota bacterium]